jgi:hypothetical protein
MMKRGRTVASLYRFYEWSVFALSRLCRLSSHFFCETSNDVGKNAHCRDDRRGARDAVDRDH